MRGLKLRKIVGLFLLVLCGAAVLVAHVWKQNTYVRLSMESMRLGKACAQARNGITLMEVDVGGLRKLSRIEAIARGRFGLEYAKNPVPVYPEAGDGYPGRGDHVAARSREKDRRAENGKSESGKVAWLTRGL